MNLPYVIDNRAHTLADVLNDLLRSDDVHALDVGAFDLAQNGLDEDCYEAFARLLAGKTTVTGPIIDIYREHHPPYKRLVERIASTDALIDQIVYRLYGLTADEIAVVKGNCKRSPTLLEGGL